MLTHNLGHDAWAQEIRAAIRGGLRTKTSVDFGGLKVYRVEDNIILSNGGWVDFPISCANETAAVLEFQRLTAGLDCGRTIKELLPSVNLPVEIATAWVN